MSKPIAHASRTTSGQLAGAAAGSSGMLVGIRVSGGADVDVTIYNGTDTSGRKLAAVHADGLGHAAEDFGEPFAPEFDDGLYLSISGATPTVEVYFQSTEVPTP